MKTEKKTSLTSYLSRSNKTKKKKINKPIQKKVDKPYLENKEKKAPFARLNQFKGWKAKRHPRTTDPKQTEQNI